MGFHWIKEMTNQVSEFQNVVYKKHKGNEWGTILFKKKVVEAKTPGKYWIHF